MPIFYRLRKAKQHGNSPIFFTGNSA